MSYTKSDDKLRKEILKKCKPYSYVIYLTILSHRNNKNNNCFPNRKTLCEETSIGIAALDKHLRLLEEHGFIIKRSGTLGRSTQYYFPREKDINYSEEDMAYMDILKDQANKKREEKKKKVNKGSD